MSETRKIAAILCSDVVGFSRLAGADEDRILARLRSLRSDLIDPTIAVHNGRVVKRTGDGSIVEFRSVVDAVRCAIEVQNAMVERNAGVPADRRIVFRIGIHLGDVVEESDGDLMGDGVNIAARLEGIAEPGAICLSEHAYWQVKGRLDLAVTDLGATQLKNIAEPVRAYSLASRQAGAGEARGGGKAAQAAKALNARAAGGRIVALVVDRGRRLVFPRLEPHCGVASMRQAARLSIVVLPFTNLSNDPAQDYFADGVTENLTTDLSRIRDSFVIARNTAFTFKGKNVDAKEIGKRARRALRARRLGAARPEPGARQRPAHRCANPARISGPTASRKTWPTCSSCRIRWWRVWPTVWVKNSSRPKRERAAAPKTPTRSISPCAVGPLLQAATPDEGKQQCGARIVRTGARDRPQQRRCAGGRRYTYKIEYALGWANPGTDYEAKILGQADRAIALAPDNMWAYYAKSTYLCLSRRANEALSAADAGLAINPNFAPLYSSRGVAEIVPRPFRTSRSPTCNKRCG